MTTCTLYVTGADTVHISPDGRIRVVLEWLDEVHFGPPYYAVWFQRAGLDSSDVYVGPGRDIYYGGTVAFSQEGRFLILERWASLSSPNTSLVLLDLVDGYEVEALHVGTGFLQHARFEPSAGPLGIRCVVALNVFDGTRWSTKVSSIELPDKGSWTRVDWW